MSETPPVDTPKRETPRRARKKWARYVGYGFGAVMLGIVAVGGLAGTGPALRLVTPAINDAVSSATDSTFEIGRIEGSLWTGLSVDHVSMDRGTDGFGLDLRDLDFDWSPSALLRGHLQINRVGLASSNVFMPTGATETDPVDEADDDSGGFALPLSVALDALELGEIAVVDPTSGKSFLYTLSGRAAVGKNLSGNMFVDLEPQDGGSDHLKLDLAFDGPAEELSAEIDGVLGRRGIVMTLAGVAPESATDFRIALNGDGPASDWQGVLAVTAADYAALSSDIGLQLSSDVLAFRLDGGLTLLDQIAAQLPTSISNQIDLGIGGAFDQANQRLKLDRVSVGIDDAATITGATQLDFDASQIDATLDATIDPALSALIDRAVSWQQLALSLRAKGDLARPGIELAVDGQDIRTPVSQIDGIRLGLNVPLPVEANAPFTPNLSLSARGTVWDGGDLATLFGDSQNLSVDGVIAPDFSDFSVRNLDLQTPDMALTGNADFDGDLVVSNANLIADIPDMSILAPLSGLDLRGAGRIGLEGVSGSIDQGGRSNITVSAHDAAFGIADLDRIVGTAPSIKGTVAMTSDLDLAIDLSAVDTAMIKGPVKVDLGDAFSTISVAGNLDIAPGVVPPGIGVEIDPAKLDVNLSGDIATPSGQITLRVPKVAAGGQSFEDVSLITQMNWSDQAVLALSNRAEFQVAAKRYNLAADVMLPANELRIDGISLRGDGVALAGALSLPGYTAPMRGKFALSNLEANLLADFGAPFTSGLVAADIELMPDGARQSVMLSAVSRGLRLASGDDAEPILLETIKFDASVADAFDTPEITAKIDGAELGSGRLSLDGLRAEIIGGLESLDVTFATTGLLQGQVPLEAEIEANLGLGADINLRASKLSASVGDQTITLERPLQVALLENGRQQVDAGLLIGSGALRASLDQEAGQRSVAGDVALENLALGPWGEMFGVGGITGVANLNASLRETRGTLPSLRVSGGIDGITSKVVEDMQPFEIAIDALLEGGNLSAQASVGNPQTQLLTADGSLPLAISVLEQDFAPDLNAPISARVRIDGEIAEFWPYVPAPDHLLSGDLDLALDVAGTLDDVRWNGDVTLDGGQYENLVYGTILDQMTLAGTFNQNGLSIPSFTATDGGNGTVEASVDLRLLDAGAVSYDVSATLRDVALSRKDELQFWANVDATVTGNETAADIKSTVAVQRGEVDLTLALPESVPTIEVANLPDADEVAAQNTDDPDENAFTGRLDVVVDVPGRLFVRGKGLDSEWGGRLEVSGTTDEPLITGQLSALRGQLDVIGKTFVIKDSNIVFAGANPPDPMLDISAVYTTEDLVVTAGFQGHASDPELVLTSNPSLPEDEILSQVLFGKSQGSLSAIEAVQLANALNELSGGGTGLDVVGSIRRFIGADVLQVGGGEGGPEVKVGKYLTEGVYVGTKAGATPGSSGVEVEIEVTPSISVTSETTEIDSKAGVQYRLDY